jgi:copper oxidase (laccase) domain-containing protein
MNIQYTNRHDAVGEWDCPQHHLVAMRQTHSNDIAELICADRDAWVVYGPHTATRIAATASDSSHNNAAPFTAIGRVWEVDADAVITQSARTIVSVRTADCLPIIVASGPYIGAIHAGRQGTLSGISERFAQALRVRGCDSATLWCGPHICEMCYEIDADTHTHFDLLEPNIAAFRQVFGPSLTVTRSMWCTRCHADRYFSYRAGDAEARNVFYGSLSPFNTVAVIDGAIMK